MGEPRALPIAGSHLLELTLDAFRVGHRAASAAAEGIATSSKSLFAEVRDHERELDSLDRDIDDLVTATITQVPADEARTLLACMKFGISLERIGDLLLSFANRAESVAATMGHDDLRDLMVMTSKLEQMLDDVETAFRTRSLDKAVNVLRADAPKSTASATSSPSATWNPARDCAGSIASTFCSWRRRSSAPATMSRTWPRKSATWSADAPCATSCAATIARSSSSFWTTSRTSIRSCNLGVAHICVVPFDANVGRRCPPRWRPFVVSLASG